MRFSRRTGFYVFLVCLFVILVSLFWIVSTYAQDIDPGDPVMTCDPNEDFQIRWHGAPDWTTVVPTDMMYSPDPLGNHEWITWSGSPIVETWESLLPDGITKVQAVFSLTVPVSGWFTYYECRLRCRVYEGTANERVADWSIPNKVYVITIGRPGRGRKTS